MKRILLIIIILTLTYSLISDETIEQLVNEAFAENPEISMLEYQIKALQEKKIFVQKLMDPMLALEYSNVPYNTWKLDENPMSGVQFKLMQTIPFPGKNIKRKAVAESEGKIKIIELEELKLQLKDKVKKTYFQLDLNRELKAISLKHIALLENFIETMINKYEIGKSAQSDILRMTLMKEKLLDDLEDFEHKENELQAMLNSVLNRKVNTFISTNQIGLKLNIQLDFDTLLDSAKENRQIIKKIKEIS